MGSSLDFARKEINEIDAELARLFEKRMHAVESVAEYKKERGLPILDPAREAAVIARSADLIENEELRPYFVSYIKSVMAVSRSYQEKLISGTRVAFSGDVGAYAHIAANKMFAEAVKVPYKSFTEAYRAVEDGECELAVLPIENSTNGEVGEVSDLLFSGSLFVNRVYDLPITHDLLGVKGATAEDIRCVLSHPQALGQCRDYIREKGLDTTEVANTATAAKEVAKLASVSVGAIASEEAAKEFGLVTLDKNLCASRSNTTRFAVLSRTENKTDATSAVCSMLHFTVRHEAGALAGAIDIIGKCGFNMLSLRSRPIKNSLWQYYFVVELEGNLSSREGEVMLNMLRGYCDKVKPVGTYDKP